MAVDSNFVKSTSGSIVQESRRKGRISRIVSHALVAEPCISCTTFNILAPIYKRLDKENQSCRESEYKVYWLSRNQSILDRLLYDRSSIICLQEFWVGNEELVDIYEKRLGDAGYINFKLARTNNRGDGLLTAVHKDYFRIVDYRDLLFNDFGDALPRFLPWNQSYRFGNVYKILQYVETYKKRTSLIPCPPYSLDFIWLLNPTKYKKPLKTSWSEAVFSIIKYQLREASLLETDAFAFLKADSPGEYITFSGFSEALHQLCLTGHPHGLSAEETKDLWNKADIDGNGVVNYKEFQKRIWNPARFELTEKGFEDGGAEETEEHSVGFNVKNADLFPSEVEKGTWPEDYLLSDHARLTVVFSPARVPCSPTVC
ncbi:hypothetical protein IFM89_037133 [Coptis chinensis]|uniref:EF-hand domain-containing protein n=1 Tax=Coptis chinensis TaxID=261450 RepID=A0A835HMK8_9MAGN|nr:hypothetical protein IFM89_037133 [Coptis chinensis]